MAGARNHYIQLIEKAVEPQGEAKPDYWIMGQLAKRMGFGEAFNIPVEQMIKKFAETVPALRMNRLKRSCLPG